MKRDECAASKKREDEREGYLPRVDYFIDVITGSLTTSRLKKGYPNEEEIARSSR